MKKNRPLAGRPSRLEGDFNWHPQLAVPSDSIAFQGTKAVSCVDVIAKNGFFAHECN
jgi:hypothetical protein